jgi:aminoglycoside phosphotransferase (APT) family kinase protein
MSQSAGASNGPSDQAEASPGSEIGPGLSLMAARRFGEGARVVDLSRLSGGASQELWSFDVETPSHRHELILRRNPGGAMKRETAAGMEIEARLIRLAGDAGVPVPRVEHVLTPDEGLGSGFVMARIPGETLARRILRDGQFAPARAVLARQMGAAAAAIHSIDLAKAGDLRRVTVQGSLDAAFALYRSNRTRRPVVEWAFRWLYEHRPDTDLVPTVVHGDLRNGNVIVGPEGLRAVLDWEVVHIGDPMADLAWTCVTSWRFGEIDKPVGGFGSREDLYAGYEAAGGRRVDAIRVRFWETLGVLRWGLSCALMAREFQAGDRSVERAAIGRRASETEIDLMAMLAPLGGGHHA